MSERARLVVVCDFTPANLIAAVRRARAAAPELPEPIEAISGDVRGELLRLEPTLGASDILVVWTRPATSFPSLGAEDVAEFGGLIARLASRVAAVFVASWAPELAEREPAITAWRANGAARSIAAMNLRLAEALESSANAFVLDTARWLLASGDGGGNVRGWYLGKIPYSNGVFREAAEDLAAAVRGLRGKARKLVVLDLDNTLWGGVVGEVGWAKLRLGGHDAGGEAFVDFQRQLAALARRGVVLGIVSKNDESVALEAIARHPEMVLRTADFAGWRINWADKAQNLAELVAELNLGLDSAVFIDDHPAERDRVRAALPDVLVPDWPDDPVQYASALARLRCFDQPPATHEDRDRSAMYASERERREQRALATSNDDWLASLGIVIDVQPLSEANLARASQLLNKTNQMNLTTRRLTEVELERWAAEPGRAVETFRLRDRFGDTGITGVLGLERAGDAIRIVDYVLSCRVFGRGAEQTMLHRAVDHARRNGASRVVAEYLPTAKNGPCLEFFRDRSGFEPDPAGTIFSWRADSAFPVPPYVELSSGKNG